MIAPRTMLQAMEPSRGLAWSLEQKRFDPLRDGSHQSRFAISNGFLGVRGGRAIDRFHVDSPAPRTYVAGLFDVAGGDQPISALVQAPDWLEVGITLADGLGRCVDDESFRHRMLDFKRGALITEGRISSPSQFSVCLRVIRLVSMSERALGLQLIHMDVEDGVAEATLEASFEGLAFGLSAVRLDQHLGVWRTNVSAKFLAIAAAASLRVDGVEMTPKEVSPFRLSWRWQTRPGQSVCFERLVAVTRQDASMGSSGDEARGKLAAAKAIGWRGVLANHEECWARRWRESDVVLDGDPEAQKALRFALYHLNGAANPADDHVSIAARALTGTDYRGHVFWDTEIFLLPFFTLTWPEAARTLLMYRFRTLDAARAKAQGMGWRGALYAWESADTGDETTPEHAVGPDRRVVDILCGTQEQHISADIAYAVWQYWHITGDDEFLLDAGAEILFETARFWADRAQLEADGFCHIRGIIGPDEYHETVDDNAFTNVMAGWNIRRAVDVAVLLKERWPAAWAALSQRIDLADAELHQWKTVAGVLITGFDPQTGLFEQFTGFFKLGNHRSCKLRRTLRSHGRRSWAGSEQKARRSSNKQTSSLY